jgi:hypothetical protein
MWLWSLRLSGGEKVRKHHGQGKSLVKLNYEELQKSMKQYLQFCMCLEVVCTRAE